MMLLFCAVLLFVIGVLVSFTFAGSETAFYRVPKLRLKLDAVENDKIAKRMFWFVNNPGLFVATALVGNNIASYMISLATVMTAGCLFGSSQSIAIEIFSTLLLVPFLFVYGEAFPKNIAMQVPNQMLRCFSPVFFLSFILFIPLTMFLYLFNSITALIFGTSRDFVSLSLGKQELGSIFNEGIQSGVLFESQRQLANGIFHSSALTIKDIAVQGKNYPRITLEQKPADVLAIMRNTNLPALPVFDETNAPLGYVQAIDLEFAARSRTDKRDREIMQLLLTELPLRSFTEISEKHTLLTGLILLETMHDSFGCTVDDRRRITGFITSQQIYNVLRHDSNCTNSDAEQSRSLTA